MTGKQFAIPFGLGLLCLLGAVVMPLVVALLGIGWYATSRLEESVLAARMRTLEASISTLAEQGVLRYANTQQALADSGIYQDGAAVLSGRNVTGERALLNMLERHPNMTAGYVGFADGGFLYVAQVERLAEARRREIGVPQAATIAVRTINGEGAARRDAWQFRDAGGRELASQPGPPSDYDPRTRGWFRAAAKAGKPILSEPYAFAGTGGIGITIATPLAEGGAVIGADLSLASVSRVLAAYKVSPSSLIMLTTDNGGVMARTDLQSGALSGELAAWIEAEIRGLGDGEKAALIATRMVQGSEVRLQVNALPRVLGRPLYLAVAAPLAELRAETSELIRRSALVAAVAVAIALLLGMLASRLLSGPLGRIAARTEQFRQFDFSTATPAGSRVREIYRLEQAVEQMRGGLEQFGRYVPRQLVRRIIGSPTGAVVGGARQQVTVLFTDIEHFSQTAESMDPMQLVDRLSKYLEGLGGEVTQHDGTIDKYIGDSIMAIWNAPDADADHVAKACRAALAAARTSEWLEAKWEQRGRTPFRTRCGIHTGSAVVGNVGSLDRMNYTVVGAVPNTASRLEGLNKVYGTRIVASGDVVAAVPDQFTWRELDRVVPAGTAQIVDLYELMGEKPAAGTAEDAQQKDLLAGWSEALAAYRSGDMARASRGFDALTKAHPGDAPSQTFAARCLVYLENGLPKDWNGVTVFDQK